MTDPIYIDKHGRRYIRVAETKGGLYAWFRPEAHADDSYYDVSRKVADMQVAA